MEPLSPAILHIAALTSIEARRYTEAIDRCSTGLELDPNHPLLRLWLGAAYEQESRYEEAIRELEKGLELLENEPVGMAVLAHAHASAGNEPEARRLLHEMLDLAERRPVDPYCVALIHAGLGDQDQAFEWLEKACVSRSGWLTLHAKGDPRLDGLRADPRFASILRRMGLEP